MGPPNRVALTGTNIPLLTILETPRLRLRRMRHDDVSALVALWSDPAVTRYMGGPRDQETLAKILTHAAEDPFAEAYDLWPLEEKDSGELVGESGLLEKEIDGVNEIELVYVLAMNRWGMGYASEVGRALADYAFDVRGLKRLVSLIDPENTASARVARKVGMRLEKEIVRPGGARRLLYVIEPRLKDGPKIEA